MTAKRKKTKRKAKAEEPLTLEQLFVAYLEKFDAPVPTMLTGPNPEQQREAIEFSLRTGVIIGYPAAPGTLQA